MAIAGTKSTSGGLPVLMPWFTFEVEFETIPGGWVAGWLVAGWYQRDDKANSVQLGWSWD